MKYFVLFAACLFHVEAGKPAYFDLCCVDNTTNACVLNNINKNFQPALSGDDHFNIPSFLPARIPSMTLHKDANGYFRLGAVRIYGLEAMVYSDLQIDWKQGTFRGKVHIPQILILSTYEIDTTIEDQSYKSFGSSRITLDNVHINQSFTFVTDSNKYIFMENAVVQYTADQITYKLNNADSQLSQLLNSESNNLNNKFEPFITEALNDIFIWRFRALGDTAKITDLYNFNCAKENHVKPEM